MRLYRISIVIAALVVASAALLTACSEDPEPPVVVDNDNDDNDDNDNGDDNDNDNTQEPDHDYCETCSGDGDCNDGLCLDLIGDERACAIDCDPDDTDPCPDGAYCATVDADDNTQCVPEAMSCDDPCDDVVCPDGEHCNPINGECEFEPRICDTGCQHDAECGDTSERRCIATGAPDGETMCTTVCDPDATGEEGDLECPSDFVCVELGEAEGDEDASSEGVCYPLDQTCTDRCQDVECGGGQNCDPVTGDCVDSTVGVCEDDCEINADCEGQDDMCLNLGIGDGPHCWQDCTADQNCPDGYDCTSLLGLTSQLCLPENQQCTECYDADCHPEGVCNPVSGECMPHPEDCTIEGCDGEQICDPISQRCVDVDRSCSGESWAVDCDNVITRCTSQRPDADGVCATMCSDDSDCAGDRSCEETIHGSLCLEPNFGGPPQCGVIAGDDSEIGQPCGDNLDDCDGDGIFCAEAGDVPGFCSTGCTGDSNCPDGATCGVGPDGFTICLPAQCRCAGAPDLVDDLTDGWQEALNDLGMTACDLFIYRSVVDDTGDWDDVLLDDASLAQWHGAPVAAMGEIRAHLASLDDVSHQPGPLVAEAAAPLDISLGTPQTSIPTASSLADALSDLAASAGGSTDPSDVDDELSDLPDDVEELATDIVEAIDNAYQQRDQAFSDAGIDTDVLDDLFEQTHRLWLPHGTDQDVLDVDDPDIADAIDNFPLDEITQIGADLAVAIEIALNNTDVDPDTIEDEFSVHVDTPAGAVIIGDSSDNVYEEDADFDGTTALILEIGGDNTYEIPVGANQSVANGISIAIDLDGADTYTYDKVGDDNDGDRLLESDDAGRLDPADAGDDGPVSLSETARQGAGRLGVGMVFDRGSGQDTYETLRLGQGAGIFGVGALFDQGTDAATFDAEAFAQGAGFHGVGLLYSAGGDNIYRLWHAGQGMGIGGGVGLLYDKDGHDDYTAVTGTDDDDDILYYSPTDGGNANRSLAQGASAGIDDIAAGLGILRDYAGNDTYTAASYAQGYSEDLGVGVLGDADGDDDYLGRSFIQGTGVDAGVGVLLDLGGDDDFNQRSNPSNIGQGIGDYLGWGAFVVEGGTNDIRYSLPGGGVAFDGGMAFSLFDGGPNDHNAPGGGLGLASFNAPGDSPLADTPTVGIFVQTGAEQDSYSHPDDNLDVENDAIWRQDDSDVDEAFGVGVDE